MSNHSTPIVPTVLVIPDQRHPWRLAGLGRYDTHYHTPTTVRVGTKGAEQTMQQTNVYCIADDAAWSLVTATQAALQLSLDVLAGGLRTLGSYASQLAIWKGVKTAPNPLSATVIRAPDPDLTQDGYYHNDLVPRVDRLVIRGHTPKMLRGFSGVYETPTHQRDCFVCPDDAAWQGIEALRAAAEERARAWEALLKELGTYSEALKDGRYAQRPAAAPPQPPVPNWPRVSSPLLYGHHRNATSGGVTHVWQPAPSPRSKQRHETLCHIVMTEPPTPPAPWQGLPGQRLRLCPQCRQAASELASKQEGTPMATQWPAPAHPLRLAQAVDETDLDNALVERFEAAGYRWQMAKQTPDGRWHHVISARNHALLRNDQMLMRRERLEALLAPTAVIAVVEPAGALSTALQSIARDYVAAREKAGRALLEMANYLALARSLAKHGEWYTFLQATQTSEDQADRLLDIDRKASEDAEYADAVRRNFLSPTTAALLARPSTPAAVVEQVLSRAEPPTTRAVEQQIQAARVVEPKSRSAAGNAPVAAPAQPQPKPATCIRCGAERSETRSLTSYQAGFIDAYPGRDVTLCSRCIPELLAEQRAAQRAKAEAAAAALAPITVLTSLGPREVVPLQTNGVLALHMSVTPGGAQTISHVETGRAVAAFARPKSALAAYEQLIALDWQLTPEGGTGPVLGRAICTILVQYDDVDSYENRRLKLEELTAQAAQPTSSEVVEAPAVLSRPHRPEEADVSAQLRYLEQLESYATTLEQRIAELERWLAANVTFIRTQLAICEQRIADGSADAVTGAELATLAMDLEALADDESVSTDVYERLAVRLGQAQRGLVELTTEHEVAR